MFMTLEKYRSMQRYDDARTRIGRILGFVYIARVNGVSWKSTVDITVRALRKHYKCVDRIEHPWNY
jgi:hypothetical protein